jgi:hypothetical protein
MPIGTKSETNGIVGIISEAPPKNAQAKLYDRSH